jgi:hypothetical protein
MLKWLALHLFLYGTWSCITLKSLKACLWWRLLVHMKLCTELSVHCWIKAFTIHENLETPVVLWMAWTWHGNVGFLMKQGWPARWALGVARKGEILARAIRSDDRNSAHYLWKCSWCFLLASEGSTASSRLH